MRTRALWACSAFALVVGCGDKPEEKAPPPASQKAASIEQPVFAIDPTAPVASSPELLDAGSKIFGRQCAPCHGSTGAGDGPAAYLLYPKPRNLQKGPYRFVSTWEGAPTDEDIYRTISRGIPGSAMPSWAHLSEKDRWALVHHVKTLSKKPIVVKPPKPAQPDKGAAGQGVVEVPKEPPADHASVSKGAEIFVKTCSPCHGPTGQGDGPNAAQIKDDDGIPLRPRDLWTGVFKGDPRPEHLYRRIVHGIPGTPMPTSPNLANEDGWHVVHYLRTLSTDRLRERAEMKRSRIPVVRLERLPDHPDAGDWRKVPKVELHLMPLWWRFDRPEYLTIQAAFDEKTLAVLLTWSDATEDAMVVRPQDFRDAVAVELAPPGDDPPFFAMGEKGRFVDIWMWKSDRQADLAAYHDLEAQYPNAGTDSYPNATKSPYEQPSRKSPTLDSDPTFITAWGAGNIVADPTRKTAAEDLVAQGFGTLKARPAKSQAVGAHGVHNHGSYRVLFRRTLAAPGEGAVDFTKGTAFPAAFAVWNGSAGDRDGKKSVTIWQELVFLR